MQFNISQILDYQRCPIVWHNKYVSRRAVPAGDGALNDGTYWHKLAEAYLNSNPLLPAATNPVQDRMREFVETGGLPKLPVLGTEVALRMPLGKHVMVGALDGIMPAGVGGGEGPGATRYETFYSVQWKTCAGGMDLDRQCDAVQMSYHECAYEALMNANGYPCAGTYLGVYKKLTKAELSLGTNPLHTFILQREPEYVSKVLGELETFADEMEEIIAGKKSLRPHRRSCIIGNMRCQFWASCYEGLPLTDDRYEDSLDRYPTGGTQS